MKTIVVASSPRSRTISSCMSRRMTGSRAENGSSNSSTSGPVAKGAGQPDALHAAGELVGAGCTQSGQPDQLEELLGSRPADLLVDALHLEAERHVVQQVTVRQQAEVLEDHAHSVPAEVE